MKGLLSGSIVLLDVIEHYFFYNNLIEDSIFKDLFNIHAFILIHVYV